MAVICLGPSLLGLLAADHLVIANDTFGAAHQVILRFLQVLPHDAAEIRCQTVAKG